MKSFQPKELIEKHEKFKEWIAIYRNSRSKLKSHKNPRSLTKISSFHHTFMNSTSPQFNIYEAFKVQTFLEIGMTDDIIYYEM